MKGIKSHTCRSPWQIPGLWVLLFFFSHAQALTPEHETRRLMLATEEAIEEEQWQQASEYLNRLQGLGTDKPPAYLYYRGKVMLETGFEAKALAALENYIEEAGEEGQYYTDTLKMITRIEQQGAAAAQSAEDNQGEQVAVIEPAGTGTLKGLKQLYLADSDAQALEVHLNTLLGLAGWYRDARIVKAGAVPDIHYRVTAAQGQIKI
ncbi:MAG: hypothetical protein KGY54_13985, partial [Oleiphilaceae bacterium]|nr:hypothetical protein [Oleiphilaceae bacterium]